MVMTSKAILREWLGSDDSDGAELSRTGMR
jgi:hypothetical protein